MNKKTLLKNAKIYNGSTEAAFTGDVLIEGDRIIEVNDTVIAGVKMKNSRIMKMLRGKKGTEVDVKVLRRQAGQPDDTVAFTITRGDIPIHSVDAAYMVDKTTGYIRIKNSG